MSLRAKEKMVGSWKRCAGNYRRLQEGGVKKQIKFIQRTALWNYFASNEKFNREVYLFLWIG